ncbi:hypothetical protein LCGC14_2863420, partial [marine sediment metagenome]
IHYAIPPVHLHMPTTACGQCQQITRALTHGGHNSTLSRWRKPLNQRPVMSSTRTAPAQSIAVYRAAEMRASDGANLGDTLSFAADLVLDDTYELDRAAEPRRLSLQTLPGNQLRLAEDTDVGSPGADLHLDSLLTLMSPEGQTQEALLLVEVDGQGRAAAGRGD